MQNLLTFAYLKSYTPMSKLAINQYYQNIDRAIQFGKSRNEQSIRTPFLNLLNEYARKLNYEVVAEVSVMGTKGAKVRPDGVVKNLWGLDIGLWESKDEKDDIEAEIDAKIRKGYPMTNILFEDSQVAVLFQQGQEVGRVSVRDADQLDRLLMDFVSFKSEVVGKFEDAIEKFKADIPSIVERLRAKIAESSTQNPRYQQEEATFWSLCKAEINPGITLTDIREMMIQHTLTSDIFNRVFDDPDFHRHNTIAAELEKLIGFLLPYADRRNLLHSIEHYYEAINITAAGISDHHEKQKFLKVLYENFYKVYNPKAADRLGVVYTPNEVVGFMVRSTEYLLHKHFGKTLADRDVDILDPATGTGTFICEIIENAIPSHQLDYKFKHELHANEVAILPYYIANLNIEYTFKQKMNYYAEFPSLCFVDTLDNVNALAFSGKQADMFGLTSENTERIKRQNSRKISVIIGNPPYNANQMNENENNKNREYKEIDKRIKETYIKHSTAQKTKVYDMYSRFFRWATDRMEKNGILCFITNRSFIDSRTFDGFRKSVASEFNEIHIIDLGGDVRSNPKLSGTKHNVFGIQTGVAIMILTRRERNFIEAADSKQLHELKDVWRVEDNPPVISYETKHYYSTAGCYIYYTRLPEMATAAEKLEFLRHTRIENIPFQRIIPDEKNNWINLVENDWKNLLNIDDKKFSENFMGISTNRDEWVYDFNLNSLKNKIYFFIDEYSSNLAKNEDLLSLKIKWSRDLKTKAQNSKSLIFDESRITQIFYRPFVKKYIYKNNILLDRFTSNHVSFGLNNIMIVINYNSSKDFNIIGTSEICDLHFNGDSNCLPLYRYDKDGTRHDNITDWGRAQFTAHYQDDSITKKDIFHYVYAVLHHPAYRTKYELNLKREFPRVPFYADFRQWVAWGKALMELHIGYETVASFPLKRFDAETKAEAKRQRSLPLIVEEPQALYARQPANKAKLKADKERGLIEIDEFTQLSGIPAAAWEYKLGNRSALEWVLDQYKEKKPGDPTIAELFDTYRFADYKEHVIDLLCRVCTVSVETMRIVDEMPKE